MSEASWPERNSPAKTTHSPLPVNSGKYSEMFVREDIWEVSQLGGPVVATARNCPFLSSVRRMAARSAAEIDSLARSRSMLCSQLPVRIAASSPREYEPAP